MHVFKHIDDIFDAYLQIFKSIFHSFLGHINPSPSCQTSKLAYEYLYRYTTRQLGNNYSTKFNNNKIKHNYNKNHRYPLIIIHSIIFLNISIKDVF